MANKINLIGVYKTWAPIARQYSWCKEYTAALCCLAEAAYRSRYIRGIGNDDLDAEDQKAAAYLLQLAHRYYGRMGYIPIYPGSLIDVILYKAVVR